MALHVQCATRAEAAGAMGVWMSDATSCMKYVQS